MSPLADESVKFALSRNFKARIASAINVVLGICLMASPWVFDYSARYPVLNSVFVGTLIAMLGVIRLASNGIGILLGFWTIVSPWASDVLPLRQDSRACGIAMSLQALKAN
jgi:hypothetical protein